MVELLVTQVDYSIEGGGSTEYPVVHIFGRTTENERRHVRILGFEPYFYAPTDTIDDSLVDKPEITRTESGYESIRGEELTKICTRTPRDVGAIRDEFDHFEADILFPNRLLIDKDIKSGIRVPERTLSQDGPMQVPHTEIEPVPVDADLRVNTFDIEVDDRSGFPEDGEEPIICLTSHDSYDDTYIAWLNHAHPEDNSVSAPETLDGYDPIDAAADVELRCFDTEAGMLDAFISYLENTDPDILTGWNFEDFDMPYVLDRLEAIASTTHHDLSIERLSRIDEVWRSGWGGPNIKGRVVFDLLYAYKRTQFTELESYRLDAVGEQELDVGKERYAGDIGTLWETDPTKLLEYNLRDVELCVEIDRKQDIIAFWDEVRSFVGCKLEDAPTPGDTVDIYILHEAHNRFALPSKGRSDTEDYEGGAVFDPVSGVKENVTVLDLKSLYPMCMTTINASPETKVDPATYDGATFTAPNGTHFRRNPDGIIREMIDDLLSEREEKKTLRNKHNPESSTYEQYNRQQAAVKVIMNCFTPDTEVLTPQGVRTITELEIGEKVYSLNPETGALEMKPITATHAYPAYRGPLVDLDAPGVNFRVTPNHRMLVQRGDDEYEFIEAGELTPDATYQLPHHWNVPETLSKPASIGGETAVALPDGCGGREQPVAPRLKPGDNTQTVSPIDSKQASEELTSRRNSYSTLPANKWFQGETADDSQSVRLSEDVFTAPPSEKYTILLQLGAIGDDQTTLRVQTPNQPFRDDVLRLATETGLLAQYHSTPSGWEVIATTATPSIDPQSDAHASRASQGAYCVTVADNHTLLAGRNGQFQFVGQSLYGVLGWDRFRLYDKEMGAAVTATGREVIKHTESAANELDKDVIYGDTDSVMLELGADTSKEEAIEQSFNVASYINDSYDAFAADELSAAHHRFQIEFEKLYRRFFQAGKKKRYAGHIVWKEGKDVDDIDITGFEYKRSDIAPITKEVQKRVIEMIVHGTDTDEIASYLSDIINQFESGDIPLDKVGIPGGIGKRLNAYDTATAQVRGAKYANAFLGTNFQRGSKPKRVYLEKVHPSWFRTMEDSEGFNPQTDPLYTEFKRNHDVICFEYEDQIPEAFSVDWDVMLEKTLRGPIERIIDSLGMSWDEIKSGQQQTGLGNFV